MRLVNTSILAADGYWGPNASDSGAKRVGLGPLSTIPTGDLLDWHAMTRT